MQALMPYACYAASATTGCAALTHPISLAKIPRNQFPREDPREDVTRKMLPWTFSYIKQLTDGTKEENRKLK